MWTTKNIVDIIVKTECDNISPQAIQIARGAILDRLCVALAGAVEVPKGNPSVPLTHKVIVNKHKDPLCVSYALDTR